MFDLIITGGKAVMPSGGKTFVISSSVPPYREKWVSILSPGLRVLSMRVVMAAIPDDWRIPFTTTSDPLCLTPKVSSSAILFSASRNVGLPQRE